MGLFGNKNKNNANYISAKESRRISKENRKITAEIEKKRNRKNIPKEEQNEIERRKKIVLVGIIFMIIGAIGFVFFIVKI